MLIWIGITVLVVTTCLTYPTQILVFLTLTLSAFLYHFLQLLFHWCLQILTFLLLSLLFFLFYFISHHLAIIFQPCALILLIYYIILFFQILILVLVYRRCSFHWRYNPAFVTINYILLLVILKILVLSFYYFLY